MQKRILLSLLLGVIFSISIFSQNLKVEKITLPDSELTNLYKIDSGVYRSEQPSHEDFKALEKSNFSATSIVSSTGSGVSVGLPVSTVLFAEDCIAPIPERSTFVFTSTGSKLTSFTITSPLAESRTIEEAMRFRT